MLIVYNPNIELAKAKAKITCRELHMVKRYWNTIPVGSLTLRTPNTHVIPNNGKSTTQVRNTRLKKAGSKHVKQE